jgi:bifunctional non-homologous end joining protein LigD
MTEPLAGLPDDARRRLVAAPGPARPEAMTATLTDARFSDPDWMFERKLDGERCLAWVEGGTVRLRSRNDLRLDDTYPELVDALVQRTDADLVVDGEVVAFERGRTSFARLQKRLGVRSAAEARERARRVAVYYYLFDVLWCDGYDVRALDLRSRKAVLRRVVEFGNPLRFSTHRNCSGETYYAYACRHGWEGLIAKRASSAYVGRRSRDWLKMKCAAEQELVIVGFTEPQGSRIGFGALLVGYYEDGELRYAGKVGTGYDTPTLVSLRQVLGGLEQPTPPFSGRVRERGAHWVRPELVAQVGFTEWTSDGKLRHPRFLGLRRDKSAVDVVRERPS